MSNIIRNCIINGREVRIRSSRNIDSIGLLLFEVFNLQLLDKEIKDNLYYFVCTECGCDEINDNSYYGGGVWCGHCRNHIKLVHKKKWFPRWRWKI